MNVTSDNAPRESTSSRKVASRAFLVDLALYLPVMFLVREIYFESLVHDLFLKFSNI